MSAEILKSLDNNLAEWRTQEKQAYELLQKAGDLRFDRSVELVIFRKDVYDSKPSQLLNYHKLASNFSNTTSIEMIHWAS